MQILNSFQFKPQDIHADYLQLQSTPQSLAYGRFLYQYQYQHQHYWLKCQTAGHLQYQAGFQNELQFYQSVTRDAFTQIILPYAICELSQDDWSMAVPAVCLILPHGTLLFQRSPYDLSRDQLLHYLLQILSAVEILHQQGWVHGDLKAAHFCWAQDAVKLIDFEHCFKHGQQQHSCLTATPRYMAPELFQQAVKSYASDVYALGIILLEWLTQQRLVARSYQEWARLHCQSLKIELPGVFQSFNGLLTAMLQKEQQRRVVDFSALKRRLLLDNV